MGASVIETIPFAKLRRIQASELWKTVEFRYTDPANEAKERRTVFQTDGPFEYCQSIVRAISSASQRSNQESFADASILSVLLMPGLALGIVAIFVGVLYSTAADLEAGKEVVAQGRRAGLKQLLIWLSAILGTKVTLLIGGISFVAINIWIFRRIVKRPQILKLDFESSR